MKKMLHKIFSILLAACFILSAVPAPAAAAETDATTTNGAYTDGVWGTADSGSVTYDIDGTNVTLSKTAAPVEGQENTFDITLKVETSTSTSLKTSSGALVLVIDVSGSMDFCAECGGGKTVYGQKTGHEEDCTHYNKQDNGVTAAQSRMNAAKIAATNFLSSYAGTDASADRQLSIVVFATNYSVRMDWVNVAGGAGMDGYDTAQRAINNLGADGGTNLEGGLYTASGQLDSVADYGSKSVVLLTDGVPTYRMGFFGGNGSDGSKENNDAAAKRAGQIKAKGATLYTVCFGVADDQTYRPNGPTVGNFLRDSVASSGCAYNADNSAELYGAFTAITESITSGLSGKDWTATDPMADMISVTSGTGENFSGSEGTYTWKLSNAETVTEGNTTTYVYTYTYTVMLDVQGQNFEEGKYFPTNKPTYLNVGNQQYAFPVPGVKGVLPRTDISVTKKWEDNNNQDGMRATSVEVKLQKKVNDVWTDVEGATATLNADNGWTHKWDGKAFDLIAKSKNQVHEYQVVETEVPDGYTPTPGTADNDFTVTNTHEIIKTSVTVTKVWADNNNQDGIRPSEVTVNLLADGEVVDTATVTAAEGWTYTFEQLDAYSGGQPIVYTAQEASVPAGYIASVTGDAANGFTVTNTHELDTIDISVEKIWDDAENQDKTRPDSVTIHLLADGVETGESLTLNEGNQWTGTFNDLIKNREGKVGEPVVYTVTEDAVPNYEDPAITPVDGGFKITNTHELDTIDISVKKEWVDAKNQDGLRKDVTIHLLADGNDTGKTLTLNEGNQWTGTFTGLTKNREGKVGEPVVYTVTEDIVAGYEDPVITGSVADGFTVTNTHTPEKTSVNVTKVWDDAENQDNKRPQSVTVKLLAGGKETDKELTLTATENWTGTFSNLDKFSDGVEIEYTIEEVAVQGYDDVEITGDAATGFTITNSYTPELIDISGEKTWVDNDNAYNTRPESITITLKGGEEEQTLTVTAKDGWKWSFTDLPKYAKGQVGQEIAYTIVEEAVADYNTEYDGYNVINTLAPGETSVTVTKKWEDNNDQDGIRPNEVKILLLADGEETGDTLILTKNNWTDAFTNLPMYKDGKEIVYDVREVPVEVEGYSFKAKSGDMKEGFVITNGYTVKTVNIEGTKTWDDNNDKNLSRPDSIVVRLLANGTEVDKKTVTADDNWSYEFTGKPMNENGKPIAYTVSEDPVDDYSATYNGYNITNTYSPRTINIQVTKAWNDANDQDGKRPESITVKLQADILDVEETLTLTAEDNWTGSFTNLVKYSDGKEVKYSIVEEKVEGYETVSITGDQSKGFTITNTHEPEVIKQIAGKKTWNDANNQDGKRPESITVKLLANGQVVDTQVVSEKESWIYSFENLPKFEAGEEIIYTVVENEVPGYSATYSKDNYNITNSYTPETINIKVSKSWVDSNDADGIRPTKVTIYLYANGEKTGDKLVLTKDEKWTGSFTDLPKYEDGKEIKYTIAEKDVKGYNAVIKGSAGNGFTVTNSHNSIPKTGDERTPILWIAMMLLAIIVVFFASRPFFYKKGKYSR